MLPHPTFWRSILILSSLLRLGLPSGLFPLGFPNKPLYALLLSPICTTCPAQLILLDLVTLMIFGEEYRSLSSSLCNFLYSPVISSLLGPNILFSTLFLATLSLRFSLTVSDHVPHPYETKGKIIMLYILIFIFYIATGRHNILHRMTANIPGLQSALNFFMNRILIC